MCLFCNEENMQVFANREYVNCSGCTQLTELPRNLLNLTYLNCSGCVNLTSIPDTYINLTVLHCFECINLRNIPDTLQNLKHLDCGECKNLIEIPESLNNLTYISHDNCPILHIIPSQLNVGCTTINSPWVLRYDKIHKLNIVQGMVRRFLRLRRSRIRDSTRFPRDISNIIANML